MRKPIPAWVPTAKLYLFGLLIVCSIIDLALLGIRLQHVPGSASESPYIPELIATASLTILCSIFYGSVLMRSSESRSQLTTSLGEMAVLTILYILWISGVAIGSASVTCSDPDCSVQAGLLTMIWLTWALMTVVIIIDAVYGVSNGALFEPLPQLGQSERAHVNLDDQGDIRQNPTRR